MMVTSLCVKLLLASDRVKVMRSVSPGPTRALVLLIITLGAVLSAGALVLHSRPTLSDAALLASAPSLLRAPVALLKLSLATMTKALETLALGVKVAE